MSSLFRRHLTRGVGTGLAQSSSFRLGASARRPSPCPETPLPSLWSQKSLEGGTGDAQDTGIQGAREKDTDHVPLQSASGPWLHCHPVTKPAYLPPPHPHLRCGETRLQVGLLGPQPWATTVMSLPLFPDPFLDKFSRTTPPPFPQTLTYLEPAPPPL